MTTKPTYEEIVDALRSATWAAECYQGLALRGKRIGNGAATAAALEAAMRVVEKLDTGK